MEGKTRLNRTIDRQSACSVRNVRHIHCASHARFAYHDKILLNIAVYNSQHKNIIYHEATRFPFLTSFDMRDWNGYCFIHMDALLNASEGRLKKSLIWC